MRDRIGYQGHTLERGLFDVEGTADRIRDAISDAGYKNIKSFARDAGVRYEALSAITRYERLPRLYMLWKLSKVLNKPMEYFLVEKK